MAGFTHYPKLVSNLLLCWVQPAPPDNRGFLSQPRFRTINHFTKPLEPAQSLMACHDAQNFTRLYGSIHCDQPLEVVLSFSNDEVAPDGSWVRDEHLPALHYDAEALRQSYDPSKQGATGKFFATIYGRWLCVEIKNFGKAPTEELRFFLRGSVF
jgi:hypothetical protein